MSYHICLQEAEIFEKCFAFKAAAVAVVAVAVVAVALLHLNFKMFVQFDKIHGFFFGNSHLNALLSLALKNENCFVVGIFMF